MKEPEKCKCSICGYTWITGQDETHSCTENLLNTIDGLKAHIKICDMVLNDQVVCMQSTWIEWQHGKGAEVAMSRIHNRLCMCSNIPDVKRYNCYDAQDWINVNSIADFNKTKIADS